MKSDLCRHYSLASLLFSLPPKKYYSLQSPSSALANHQFYSHPAERKHNYYGALDPAPGRPGGSVLLSGELKGIAFYLEIYTFVIKSNGTFNQLQLHRF